MFSCVMSQKYEGSEFAKELYKITGGKKLAIIYQNTDQGVLATDLFANEWENLGGLHRIQLHEQEPQHAGLAYRYARL